MSADDAFWVFLLAMLRKQTDCAHESAVMAAIHEERNG